MQDLRHIENFSKPRLPKLKPKVKKKRRKKKEKAKKVKVKKAKVRPKKKRTSLMVMKIMNGLLRISFLTQPLKTVTSFTVRN